MARAIKKQNLTISLDQETIRKARILAARRSTSISGLVAQQIESLIGEQEAYERAKQHALALLEKGFHLGGKQATRDELHER
jgi:predicted transcriptional regulator